MENTDPDEAPRRAAMATLIAMAGELGRMTAIAHHQAALLTGEANRTHNDAPGFKTRQYSGQQAPKSP